MLCFGLFPSLIHPLLIREALVKVEEIKVTSTSSGLYAIRDGRESHVLARCELGRLRLPEDLRPLVLYFALLCTTEHPGRLFYSSDS